MNDPEWVKANPPGSDLYEINKAVIDWYVEQGEKTPYNYHSKPDSGDIPTDSGGGESGNGASGSGNATKEHPTGLLGSAQKVYGDENDARRGEENSE